MTEPAPDSLDARLAAWARSLGGEQYARLGYSSLDRIGDAPANDADYGESATIERIVQAMAQSGRWKEARVLRAEYFLRGLSEPARLRALRRKGCDVGRTAYYVFLASAQAYVAASLATARAAPTALHSRIEAWVEDRERVTTRDIISGAALGHPEDRALQQRVAEVMRALNWGRTRPRYRAGEPRSRQWIKAAVPNVPNPKQS